jgi:membrane associated rhomboid family serine protease
VGALANRYWTLQTLVCFFIFASLAVFSAANAQAPAGSCTTDCGQISDAWLSVYGYSSSSPAGIIAAPFLHRDTQHLVSNLMTLVVLLVLLSTLEDVLPEAAYASPFWAIAPMLAISIFLTVTWSGDSPGVGGSLLSFYLIAFLASIFVIRIKRVSRFVRSPLNKRPEFLAAKLVLFVFVLFALMALLQSLEALYLSLFGNANGIPAAAAFFTGIACGMLWCAGEAVLSRRKPSPTSSGTPLPKEFSRA